MHWIGSCNAIKQPRRKIKKNNNHIQAGDIILSNPKIRSTSPKRKCLYSHCNSKVRLTIMFQSNYPNYSQSSFLLNKSYSRITTKVRRRNLSQILG